MMKRLLDHPEFAVTDLSSLQVLSYGAAPMPLSVVRRAIESFPSETQFINAFGQTETTSTVSMLGPEDHRLRGTPEEIERKLQRLSSIGRPLPDVEIAIMDDSGNILPAGEIGEVAVRCERTMSGYYGEDEATHTTIRDGWLHTRDLGWQDEDGYIFLAGRQSDMIIRGGENVAPAEIETVLLAHDAVEDVAVIGLPDEEWGERIAAVVVPRTGRNVSADELIEFVHDRLASFKRPEQIFFTDALPHSALGKLLRRELRARYETETA
jgi:acyl-CoA synthetase (AMP-forming)/AMP-acid ligase II